MEISWLMLAGFCIIIICGVSLMVNIYRLVYLDAKSRGMKRPKLWGALSMGGNNGEGLVLYLFKRKNYEKNISKDDLKHMNKIKKKISYILCLELIGIVVLILNI